MQEKDLLKRLRQKKSRALEAAIDQYGAYVATVARNVLGAAGTLEDAEEISSDVFLSLWEHADSVKEGKLKAWLGAVARNRARNLLRTRVPTLPMDEDVLELPDASAEDAALLKLQKEALLDAVRAMEEPDREIFLRYYYHYQTIAEIALRMGLPEGTVKARLFRGRQRLRAQFQKAEQEAT